MSAELSALASSTKWLPRISPTSIVNTIASRATEAGSLAKDSFSYIPGSQTVVKAASTASAHPFLTLAVAGLSLGIFRYLSDLRRPVAKAATGLTRELRPVKPVTVPPVIPKGRAIVYHFAALVEQKLNAPHQVPPKGLKEAAKKKAQERADFWEQKALEEPEKRQEYTETARDWRAYAEGKLPIPERLPYDTDSEWHADQLLREFLWKLPKEQTVFNLQDAYMG